MYKFRVWDHVGKDWIDECGIDKNGNLFLFGWEYTEDGKRLGYTTLPYSDTKYTIQMLISGILDINKNELYEGDVVMINANKFTVTKEWFYKQLPKFEIIGNIFEQQTKENE